MAWANRVGFGEIRRALSEQRMLCLEFESLFDWWADGEPRAISDAMRDDLVMAIDHLGVPRSHIKCGPDLRGEEHGIEPYARGLGELADRAAAVGARVALESFPFTDLSSPARSDAVVRAAARDNAGLCIDIWHVERGGVPLDEIRAIPAERIVHVELNDAGAEVVGALPDDTVDRRRLCGEGSFDLRGFVDAVAASGYDGAWGVEILSAEHRALGLQDAVRLAHDTTIKACFA
jgi:sugar phosphate isomerase/epimerase